MTAKKSTKKVPFLKCTPCIVGVVVVVLLILSGIIYSMTKNPSTDDTSVDAQTTDSTTSDDTNIVVCDAVQSYLKEQENVVIAADAATVANGNQVVVDYIGRLTDGEVFDTSVESVAQGCGTYTQGRDYTSGLPFGVGEGQMIAGFDKAVVGMKVGETKTVTIPTADAYGAKDPANVQTLPLDQLPPKEDGSAYVAGDKVYSMMGELTIQDVSDAGATIDFNHPLAGKDLIFDITIKSAK